MGFSVFTMKIKPLPIFSIIFDISASKYVSIPSFKEIGGSDFLEVYPMRLVIQKSFISYEVFLSDIF